MQCACNFADFDARGASPLPIQQKITLPNCPGAGSLRRRTDVNNCLRYTINSRLFAGKLLQFSSSTLSSRPVLHFARINDKRRISSENSRSAMFENAGVGGHNSLSVVVNHVPSMNYKCFHTRARKLRQ